MKHIHGRAAAITGAASGIGRALALELTEKGCAVALSDINEEGLAETARLVKDAGGTATTHRVDVSDPTQMERFAEEAIAAHGAIHLVFNNAGITYTSNFLDHGLDRWNQIVGVNLMGVVHGCHAFLPHLLTLEDAHIINISSILGIIGLPGQTAYCATKFAVRGLSESLSAELHNTHVRVTVVHPGGVATGIVTHNEFHDPALKEHLTTTFEKTMPPRKAAAQIIRAVQRNRSRVLITREAKIGDLMKRLMPIRTIGYFSRSLRTALGLSPFESSALIGSEDPQITGK